MSSFDRLLLQVLIGLLFGLLIGSIAGLISFRLSYKPLENRDQCNTACLQQIEQFDRDCLDPLKLHNGCVGPPGSSGTNG